MKKMVTVAAGCVFLLLTVSSAGAALMSITDDFTKPGFNIDYRLYTSNNSGTASDPVSATFVIDDKSVSSSFVNGPWTITGVYFKLFEGSTPIYEAPSIPGYQWVHAGIDGWYGFQFSTPLVLGNGGAGPELTLNFSYWDSGNNVLTEAVNFKVDYVGGPKNNGGNYTGQLSNYLRVPEPGSMLLLGTGLIGLAAFRRFRK